MLYFRDFVGKLNYISTLKNITNVYVLCFFKQIGYKLLFITYLY